MTASQSLSLSCGEGMSERERTATTNLLSLDLLKLGGVDRHVVHELVYERLSSLPLPRLLELLGVHQRELQRDEDSRGGLLSRVVTGVVVIRISALALVLQIIAASPSPLQLLERGCRCQWAPRLLDRGEPHDSWGLLLRLPASLGDGGRAVGRSWSLAESRQHRSRQSSETAEKYTHREGDVWYDTS